MLDFERIATLFQARQAGYLVLTTVGIVHQVAYVRNVAHMAHLVSLIPQVAHHNIEGDG